MVLAALVLPLPPAAGLSSGGFGPMIEPPASYEGQEKCSPREKPGVVAFRRMILSAYPFTGDSGIVRACHIGGRSEHKEGRAWDWTVSVTSARDRRAVRQVFDWLFASDGHGNDHAMARRVGVMYAIWNRQIWSAYSGWRVYCVQRKRGCVSPTDGGIRSPHTDHVHFSFTWEGARKRTSFWHKDRSLVAAAAPGTSGGYVLAGSGGGVRTVGVDFAGAVNASYPRAPIVDAATGPGGYWLVNSSGRVWARGSLRNRGSVKSDAVRIAAVAAPPKGNGYWLATRSGRVIAFGALDEEGDLKDADTKVKIAGIAAAPTGGGYWVVTKGGRVAAFGDAERLGSARRSRRPIAAMASTPTGRGYWVVNQKGKVFAFGDATRRGDASDRSLNGPVVDIAPTPTGGGYHLVTAKGKVFSFGDAR